MRSPVVAAPSVAGSEQANGETREANHASSICSARTFADPSLQRASAMRLVLACCLTAACSEPNYVAKPLPPLVVPKQPTELRPITTTTLGFTAGETYVYMVRLRGFTIGTARLAVTETAITSHFATSMLAQAITSISHDLTTTLEATRPKLGTERLSVDGKARQFATDYTGTTTHSIHTAIGFVRSWARLGAAAGTLQVVVGDQLVRVELAEPSGGKDWLRIEGTLVGLDAPATFTCWLDGSQVITRIEIRSDGEQVTAELVR